MFIVYTTYSNINNRYAQNMYSVGSFEIGVNNEYVKLARERDVLMRTCTFAERPELGFRGPFINIEPNKRFKPSVFK